MDSYIIIDGRKLHYMQFGNGEDIVFLHGWGASASAFLFVAKALSRDYRVTLLDFAGFGDSDEPTFPHSVHDYANDVLVLLKELNIERAVFIGHSFGGRVSIELGTKYKNAVRAIVLIDSAGIKPRRGIKYYLKVYAHKILKTLKIGNLKGSKDYQILSSVMRRTFINVVNYDQTPLLSKIDCKVAIFWGDDDNETPLYMYNKMRKYIRNNDAFLLKGGHFSYIDDSKRFMLILSAYLKEVCVTK